MRAHAASARPRAGADAGAGALANAHAGAEVIDHARGPTPDEFKVPPRALRRPSLQSSSHSRGPSAAASVSVSLGSDFDVPGGEQAREPPSTAATKAARRSLPARATASLLECEDVCGNAAVFSSMSVGEQYEWSLRRLRLTVLAHGMDSDASFVAGGDFVSVCNRTGLAELEAGRASAAIFLFTKGVAAARRFARDTVLAATLSNCAAGHQAAGRPRGAMGPLREALALERAAGARGVAQADWAIAGTLLNMAACLSAAGKVDEATRVLGDARVALEPLVSTTLASLNRGEPPTLSGLEARLVVTLYRHAGVLHQRSGQAEVAAREYGVAEAVGRVAGVLSAPQCRALDDARAALSAELATASARAERSARVARPPRARRAAPPLVGRRAATQRVGMLRTAYTGPQRGSGAARAANAPATSEQHARAPSPLSAAAVGVNERDFARLMATRQQATDPRAHADSESENASDAANDAVNDDGNKAREPTRRSVAYGMLTRRPWQRREHPEWAGSEHLLGATAAQPYGVPPVKRRARAAARASVDASKVAKATASDARRVGEPPSPGARLDSEMAAFLADLDADLDHGHSSPKAAAASLQRSAASPSGSLSLSSARSPAPPVPARVADDGSPASRPSDSFDLSDFDPAADLSALSP